MARMIDADRLLRELTALSHGQVWPGWTYDGIRLLIERQPTLTQPNEPLTLEDAKKERYIWFTPLNDWAKVTPFGVLFFGSEELITWETLCEEWGYRFKAYRRPPEGEEEEKHVIEITENL